MKILTLIVVCMLAVSARAQETLFDSLESGGFGGPFISVSPIHGTAGIIIGGRGGWIINHTFIIGAGGGGLTNRVTARTIAADTTIDINFSYGGLYLDYIMHASNVFHPYVTVLIGSGSAGTSYRYRSASMTTANGDMSESTDNFFVLEPGIGVEANLFKSVRVNLGVSYRYVSGINLTEIRDADFNSMAAALTVKFGEF